MKAGDRFDVRIDSPRRVLGVAGMLMNLRSRASGASANSLRISSNAPT